MESSKSINKIFQTDSQKDNDELIDVDKRFEDEHSDRDSIYILSKQCSPEVIPWFNQAVKNGNWDIPGALPLQELEAILHLRSDQDKLSIFKSFSNVPSISFSSDVLDMLTNSAPSISFSSDVLGMLMHLVPYPIPVRTALVLPKPYKVSQHFFNGGGIHSEQYQMFGDRPSKWQYKGLQHDNFNIDIPWPLKTYEINTNWGELSAQFTVPPTIPFRQMLDQLSIGSYNLLCERDNHHKYKNCEKPFPPLFLSCIDVLPLQRLSVLSNNYPQDIALEILRDWGLILRDALSNLPSDILGELQACGGSKMIINRAILKNVYERATLRWLTKRYGLERLL